MLQTDNKRAAIVLQTDNKRCRITTAQGLTSTCRWDVIVKVGEQDVRLWSSGDIMSELAKTMTAKQGKFQLTIIRSK